jgi:hypothetical protein
MNARLLIDSIVRQTTVLIAQLATSGGIRAPLAHIANQVFLELARELHSQGVSRKVSADMFGMAIRAYQRKLQRLSESYTDRGRSLREAILDFITSRDVVTRVEVLQRFHRDENAVVRSVLHDLNESGLVFCTGHGPGAVFRAATTKELGTIRDLDRSEGLDELLWVLIYRNGPLSRAALLEQAVVEPSQLEAALQRLTAEGRISAHSGPNGDCYRAGEFFVPLDARAGWEAAVFDHYQALVQTICCKLQSDAAGAAADDEVGGSTYTLDIWPGHPLEEEARGCLREFRARMSDLRIRTRKYNTENGIPSHYRRVVVYGGQCVLPTEKDYNTENKDAA